MPAVLVMIMLIFQVALLWHARQAADVAAEEAIEAAQLANATAADGQDGADAILNQVGNLRDAVVIVERDDAAGTVTVTVQGRAARVVPFGSWQVEAVAHGSIEAFVSAVDR